MKTILTIWTKPQKTFEYLAQHEDSILDSHLDSLFYLGSLAMMLPEIPGMIHKFNTLGGHPLYFWIVISFIISLILPFIGVLLFKYVHSFMLWVIGKALQGEATKSQVRLVLAYSMIPGIVSLFLSCMLIIIALFKKDIDIIGYQNPITLFLIWIFGFRTLLYGIARFNKFSYGYALLNVIISLGILQAILLSVKHLIQ